MDIELSAIAASTAILKKTQLTSIEANLSSQPIKGGELTITTEVALTKNKAGTPDVLSSIKVSVVGLPQNAEPDTPPSFTINVTTRGVYEWVAAPDPSVFKDDNFSFLLAKPLYVLAISEIHSIAHKLGLQGVRLDWTLAPPPKAKAPRKSPASKNTDLATPSTPKTKPAQKKDHSA